MKWNIDISLNEHNFELLINDFSICSGARISAPKNKAEMIKDLRACLKSLEQVFNDEEIAKQFSKPDEA